MKKVIFTLIISMITLPVFAQEQADTTAKDTVTNTTVINHWHKTKVVTRTVRDTVYTTPPESYLKEMQGQQESIDSLSVLLKKLMASAEIANQKAENFHRFNVILLVFVIVFIAFLAVLARKMFSVFPAAGCNDGPSDPSAPSVPVESQNPEPVQEEPVQEEVTPAPAVVKPSLQAYGDSVHKFTVINDNIYSLRRKDNKELLNKMLRYLSGLEQDTAELIKEIRNFDMPVEIKEQFISLVSEISAFMAHDKPIIDACLADNEVEGIRSYEAAVRMPAGLAFDPELDSDVLGDECDGQIIVYVRKLGYYFPGNTVKPYRQKSVVAF